MYLSSSARLFKTYKRYGLGIKLRLAIHIIAEILLLSFFRHMSSESHLTFSHQFSGSFMKRKRHICWHFQTGINVDSLPTQCSHKKSTLIITHSVPGKWPVLNPATMENWKSQLSYKIFVYMWIAAFTDRKTGKLESHSVCV